MKIPFLSKKKKSKKELKSKKKDSKSKKVKKKVTIYTTKTCPWCAKTKEFFKKHKVKYTEKDVGKSKKNAEQMIKKSGQSGTPVIDIGGEIIVGYNESKIKRELGI